MGLTKDIVYCTRSQASDWTIDSQKVSVLRTASAIPTRESIVCVI
jgi:hypothetical protein